jgi:hypothetical protein
MIQIVEKLKGFFLAPLDLSETEPVVSNFQFIRSKKGILRELTFSKQTGYVIGINSPGLGEGMFLTTVADIFSVENEEIVVLKPYDIQGICLHRTHLSIDEIISVCPFNTEYVAPAVPSLNKELVH